ncbi:MAG: AMP-binding protein [Anaerolineales bacterium]|nr:AMP-binding protein [Anaerolineales bacterium]
MVPDARACLYYTSGSTGQPKGVLHSQRNVLYHMALIGSEWSIGPADRMLHIIPCSFIGAMYLSWGSAFSWGNACAL